MERRYKVLLLVRQARGGMRHHLLSLAANLPRDEFELEAAGPPDQGLLRELESIGLPTHPWSIPTSLNPWRDLRATAQLFQVVRHGRYDLVHAHGFMTSVPGRLASRLAGGPPVVYTVHNFVAPLSRQNVYRRVHAGLERLLAPATGLYIAVSQALADSLTSDAGVDPGRIRVIHNGLDLALFRDVPPYPPGRDTDALRRPVVLCVARLVREKGLSILLAAARRLADLGRRPRFVIAGDGPLRGELRDLANTLGLSDSVDFLGYRDDVLSLYAQADVVAFPSLAEGLSVSLLEAMAAGRPVVVTRTGGMVELVADGESGLVVPPGDANALAAGIDRLLADSALAGQVARGALAVAAGHSVAEMAVRTREAYLEVLRHRAAGTRQPR